MKTRSTRLALRCMFGLLSLVLMKTAFLLPSLTSGWLYVLLAALTWSLVFIFFQLLVKHTFTDKGRFLSSKAVVFFFLVSLVYFAAWELLPPDIAVKLARPFSDFIAIAVCIFALYWMFVRTPRWPDPPQVGAEHVGRRAQS